MMETIGPVEIARHVWIFRQGDGTWGQNNSLLVGGAERFLLVDLRLTGVRTLELLTTATVLADGRPIDVLLTHAHGDHTNGLSVLRHGTVVYGSTGCRASLQASPFASRAMFPWARTDDIAPGVPTSCFERYLEIDLGDRIVRAHELGAGHSSSDTIVEVADAGVIACGDLHFQGGTPYVATGSVSGAIRQLDSLVSFDAAHLVAGHGPLGRMQDAQRSVDYLNWIWDKSDGISPDPDDAYDRARSLRASHAHDDLFNPERLVGNLARAALDRQGIAPGSGLDIPAIVGAMAAYARRPFLSDLC